jgi:PA domain
MLAVLSVTAQAATLEIVNANAPGVGFNDPTPAAPVGGNPGTTLGEQRLNVFNRAAKIWGERLNSDIKIQVLSSIEPLRCTATSAVLGSAGPLQIFRDFPNAPKPETWYTVALANKLAKEDLVPGEVVTGAEADIRARFNSELGKPGCFEGGGFYLGFDGKIPLGQAAFITTVLHEFGHGLGFISLTDETTGERIDGSPDVWEQYMYDNTLRKTWLEMTNDERKASAINGRQLAWNGPRVRAKAPDVLERGVPDLFVAGRGFNRFVLIGAAEFGPPLTDRFLAAPVVPATDTAGLTTACVPLSADSAAKVAGKVALIDRGGCPFTIKVKNAQLAGAKAVIVADNVAGSPPPELAGEDATITIPAVRVTLDDGTALRTAATAASNPFFGPISVLFKNELRVNGTDLLGRPLLYTPNPLQLGSSVSHFDTSAKPNLLMEPSINDDLTQSVRPPQDLTLPLLRDIGW